MKVIFYGHEGDRIDTTANMLATAVLADILYERKSILLQIRFLFEASDNLYYGKENFMKSLREKLYFAEELYDVIYLDASMVKESVAGMIFNEGDIAVVNLNQNQRVLDDFFHNSNTEEMKGDILYLLGEDNLESSLNIDRLMKLYPTLNEKNTFFIPYNKEMRSAVLQEKLHSYFYKHICCEKDDVNYGFVNEVKKVTKFIMEKATRA